MLEANSMKDALIVSSVFAVVLGVSAAAQSPSQTTPQPPSQNGQTQGTPTQSAPTQATQPQAGQIQQPPGTQGSTPAPSQPVTLTGCLTPATGTMTAGGYTLNNVTGAAGNGPTSYTLIGGDRTAMGTYGNSRVEVLGTLDPQINGASSGAVGTSGTRSADPVGAAGRSGPRTGAPNPASASGSPVTGAVGTAGTGVDATGAGAAGTGAAGAVTTPPAGATPPPPAFHVTTIRQVPGSCGGEGI